jgi:hypothetical protein
LINRIFYIAGWSVGAALIVAAVVGFFEASLLYRYANAATGVVVGIIEQPERPFMTVHYYPEVQFTTKPGDQTTTFISNVGDYNANKSLYGVGQRVQVLYNPDDPSQAEISNSSSRQFSATSTSWGESVVLLTLGICTLFITLYLKNKSWDKI